MIYRLDNYLEQRMAELPIRDADQNVRSQRLEPLQRKCRWCGGVILRPYAYYCCRNHQRAAARARNGGHE